MLAIGGTPPAGLSANVVFHTHCLGAARARVGSNRDDKSGTGTVAESRYCSAAGCLSTRFERWSEKPTANHSPQGKK
jgi:hypothetical protein